MFWHIDTDIVGLLVMCVLYYYTVKMFTGDDDTPQNRSFVWCLRAGVFMTAIDIAASVAMDVPVDRTVYHIFMTAYLLTQNLTIVSWMMYSLTILFKGDDKGRNRVSIAAWSLYAVYGALVITNPWTGLFYTLGPNMEYARGPMFIPGLVGLFYVYAISLLALVLLRRKHIPDGYPKAVLLLQPIILGIAIPVQLLNPGWLLIYSAYMICLLLAFLFLQNIRVRSERAQLKNLTEMVEHFACGMSIGSVSKNGEFTMQYLSGGLAEIYEISVDELSERMKGDMLTGVHPDDRMMVADRLVDLIDSISGEQDVTFRYVTDAGRLKWINVHSELVAGVDGVSAIYATYTDLTELKKAEQLIDVALVNTGVSIWEYDFKRRCIIQYQNSTHMHGFEKIVPNVPQSLVESGFVYPDSAAEFLAMYDRLFNGAPFAEGIFKVQTKDRKGFWYEHIRYTNAFDENGLPYRAVGMSTDETQRQEAIAKYERELEKERGFMAEEGLLAHATYDLTMGVTLDYRYQDGTDVPEDDRTLFTYGEKNARLLIDEGERESFLKLNDTDALLARFEAGETEFRLEYRRMLPNGATTWVRSTMRLLRDPRSGDILLFAYWYDIESEKMRDIMYRSITTDNYDFVARIDGKTRRFVAISKSGLTYHLPPQKGDDADEVTMSLYSDCILPEDRDMAIRNSLVENVRAHLKENRRFVFTYRMTRPDGTMRYKKVTQYYIDTQREMIAMMREDITDVIRDQAEKARVLSEALQAANQASRAKSQFLSRVSHELRTPLNAIIGFMELAKDADHEQTHEYLANSDAAAKQLLAIINDVLDVSSIESGKLKIACAPFDFKHLIANLTDLYAPQCRQKGIEYESVILTGIDEWLMGDQLRVNQVLLNLLNNAVKFTAKGHVRLSISQTLARDDKVVIRFEVEDTGCGMSEEMRSRLFRPFEQESAVTAQKYGGNGLGLSIVGSLVSMMDGAVSVKSRQGQGSVFTVDIPFSRSDAAVGGEKNKKNDAPDVISLKDMRVLLVEDNAMNRLIAQTLIQKKFGAECECAEDGKIALDKFLASDKGYYDAILMDIQMPNMDGYESTRRIRASAHPDANDVRIMALTANAFREDVAKSLSCGMNAHLSKPIEPNVLGTELKRAFDERRRIA